MIVFAILVIVCAIKYVVRDSGHDKACHNTGLGDRVGIGMSSVYI